MTPMPSAAIRRNSLIAAALCLLPMLLQLPPLLAIGIAVLGLACARISGRRPLPAWLRLALTVVAIGAVLVSTRFSVGRDTGCALLATMLALKPLETRSLRDVRSLIAYALFAPFATFLLDQGPVSMLLGLLAAVISLAVLVQATDDEAGLQTDLRHGWQTVLAALRYLLLGLPLALAVFWLFPRLASPLWGVPERALGKGGLSDAMTPGPWLDLLNDDRTAMRVQFDGPAPALHEMYWRGPVLVDFDGRTWRREATTARATPATVQPRWRYQLDMEPTDRRDIYALDWPQLPGATAVPVRQSAGGTLSAEQALTSTTRWQLVAGAAAFPAALSAEERRRMLALPAGNARSVALARQWRREAGSDDRAVIAKAMALIHRDFAYSLNVGELGADAVDDFLFNTRTGYCQHYSAAFAVLMRAAGIPTRVVTGFVGGVRNPMGGYWIVRNSDAHAWNEVWLAGQGWTRVDPTAAVAPERIYDTLADRASVGGAIGTALPAIAPIFDFADWARRGWNDMVLGFNAERQQRLLRRLTGGRAPEGLLPILFVLATLLCLGLMLALLARERRHRDPLLRAWDRLSRRYAAYGLQREPHETPADWAGRVAAVLPRDVLPSLSARFASLRYAAVVPDSRERQRLLAALRRHRPDGRTR